MRIAIALRASVVLLAMAACVPPARADDFNFSERIEAGRTLEIRNINGKVNATPASGETVEVSAIKRTRRGNPDDVEIRVLRSGGNITVCAVYLKTVPGPTEGCSAGNGPSRNSDISVEFNVRVPARSALVARTVNGAIDALGLTGSVDATTVNGDIRLSTVRFAQAQTVNGTISAQIANPSGSESLSFETVNGDITLSLPTSTDARVSAQTLNGTIRSELPLTNSERLSKTRLLGTLGSGGRDLKLKTLNGGITIRRQG